MGAERAVTAVGPGKGLQNQDEEIVVKMELVDEGKWILMGRVLLVNLDGDPQQSTAKLVHDANVVIDEVNCYLNGNAEICMYLQSGFTGRGKETVTLECSTYDGVARYPSVIALKVDDIEVQ